MALYGLERHGDRGYGDEGHGDQGYGDQGRGDQGRGNSLACRSTTLTLPHVRPNTSPALVLAHWHRTLGRSFVWVGLLFGGAALAHAQSAPPPPPPPPTTPSASPPVAKTGATKKRAAKRGGAPAPAGKPAAAHAGAEAKLLMPVLIQGQGACPPDATWQTVLDRAPVPRCKTPVQAGCMLADGRRHGPWTQYDIKRGCAFRTEVLTYKKGRRTGPAARFGVVCAGNKSHPGRCREVVTEQGGYLDGKAHGMWLTIDAQGRRRSQSQMHTGVKHGPFYFFNSSGVLIGRGCHQEGVETWRFDFRQKDRWQTPCASERVVVNKPVGDGTTKVSAEQAKASKLVRLAQATKLAALRVRYLRRAVELVPDNKGYKKLLAAAEAEAAPKK